MPRRNRNAGTSYRNQKHSDSSGKKKRGSENKRVGGASPAAEPSHPPRGGARRSSEPTLQNPSRQAGAAAKNSNPQPEFLDEFRRNRGSSTKSIIEGRLDLHPDGFGFLIAKDPTLPNVYVGEDSLKYIMHRDTVRVQVDQRFESGAKLRGHVLEVIERHQKEFLGIFRPFKGGALVIPSDGRDRKHAFKVVNLSDPKWAKLASGAAVLCHILTYPDKAQGTVEIREEVTDPQSASNDTMRILLEGAWPREFSRIALSEAEHRALRWKDNFKSTRKDIRHLPLVTIDGRDARDFDDAVCAVRDRNNNIRLWVAIADVSLFVTTGTALDREAFDRSTSVYFPDHVVPMLPEVLSNGVCSLNPFEDRACLVCECVISPQGKVVNYEFYEGLMQSKRRLTYEQMQAFMDKDVWALNELQTLSEHLTELVEVFHRLHQAKVNRGAIDLDIPEAQVILSRDGSVLDIQPRSRLDAHRLIEECMLTANECAAHFLFEKGTEGVYRVHEEPDPRKISDLVDFLSLAGVAVENKKDGGFLKEPKDFSDLIAQVKQDTEGNDSIARALQSLVLRSLKQARYSTDRLGHFALALKDYTHFTSPIRRYPDLLVHRLIKETLQVEKRIPTALDLPSQAQHCSDQERLAMEMERKLIDTKKCRYMEPRLGEEFEAWVSGVAEKGLFCQIDGHFVDGLLSADILHRRLRFRFDAEHMSYVGPGKARLAMGSRLKIKLIGVDIFTRRIDFDLVEVQ